jgi:hypothetical protein
MRLPPPSHSIRRETCGVRTQAVRTGFGQPFNRVCRQKRQCDCQQRRGASLSVYECPLITAPLPVPPAGCYGAAAGRVARP